jgi:hypothetical protein
MDDHCQFVVVVGQIKAGVRCYWGEVETQPFPTDFQTPDSEDEHEFEKRQTILRSYLTCLLPCPSAP